MQKLQCDWFGVHRSYRRLPWTGEWPGAAECSEFGWYARLIPGRHGPVRCKAGDPGAREDLNRVCDPDETKWDPRSTSFIRRNPQR
jgi:hypothetical protein